MSIIGFGEYLRHYRESRGLSLRELAHNLGVSHSYIAEIERKNPAFAMSLMRRLTPFLTGREAEGMLEAVKQGLKRDLI